MLVIFKLTGRYPVELNVLVPYLAYVRESRFRNPGNFGSRNLEFWALKSGIQLEESGIPRKIRVKNPSSTDKDWHPESQLVLNSLT